MRDGHIGRGAGQGIAGCGDRNYGVIMEPRLVEVRKNVLKQNDIVARALRERFRQEGTSVISLVSSPGSGKTAFLEKTLTLLRSRGAGWRSGHGQRCGEAGSQPGRREADHDWHFVSSGS